MSWRDYSRLPAARVGPGFQQSVKVTMRKEVIRRMSKHSETMHSNHVDCATGKHRAG